MTIPRELSIKGDVMYQWPVREIEKYRSGHIGHESVIFEGSKTLAGVKGRHLDLEMVIDFKEAKYFETINVQNYFQLISSYKIPMQKEKTLTQILV